MDKGEISMLHLRVATQRLKDGVIPTPCRNACGGLSRSIAADGRGEGKRRGEVLPFGSLIRRLCG